MSLGQIKRIIAFLLNGERAWAWFKKDKGAAMIAIQNTLKHLLYALIATVLASAATFLSDGASLQKILTDGGLPAVYAALAIPVFQVIVVGIQNLIKHFSDTPTA